MQSLCVQKLELINHLSVFVWVQLEMDCPELQGSSPLSHVLPPHSHNTLPLTFQSNKLGHFYRLAGEAAQHIFIARKSFIAVQVQYKNTSFLQTCILLCEPATPWSGTGPGPCCPFGSGGVHHPAGAPPQPHSACPVRIQELSYPSKPA